MNHHDDPLAKALSDVPTAGQRPLDAIERRALAIRHRRRAAAGGVLVAAAALVATPVLAQTATPGAVPSAPAASDPAQPDSVTDETTPCHSWTEFVQGTFLELDEVPDRMRLLWDEDAAQPPTDASMVDLSEAEVIVTEETPQGCVIPPTPSADDQSLWTSVNLYEVADDVVVRVTSVSGLVGGEFPSDVASDPVIDTAAGPLTISRRSEHVEAYWPADNDHYWMAHISGRVSDAELVELAEATRLTDRGVDMSAWPGSASADYIWHVGNDPYATHRTQFLALGQPVNLFVENGHTEQWLWAQANVGDRFVDVNGNRGLLQTGPSGQIIWVTEDGVMVTMYYSGRTGQEDLLDIARSVRPVPAHDERLAAVWRTQHEDPDR